MKLWNEFDRMVVFDTETTGIEFDRDRIIEIGAVALKEQGESGDFNALIRLPEGRTLPPFITQLTGITDEQLAREGVVSVLKKPRFLDALTVYRDRRDYPHKLCNAIEAYGLTEAENSHRAVDDARATVLLLEAMAAERDDLTQYIDLFGVHPKYGVSGRKIASVTYCPQPYDRRVPLYELAHTM